MNKAEEDYLRTIYELEEHKNLGIKSVDIAKRLKISKSSVSEMLRKLAKEKLIKIKPYSKIYLTPNGKRKAGELFDRYYSIKTFVKKFFKYEHEKAREEACKLEHAFSQDSIKIINKLIEEETNKLTALPNYVG
jgi:DtxR family Mn-dependent transcriptional regulator